MTMQKVKLASLGSGCYKQNSEYFQIVFLCPQAASKIDRVSCLVDCFLDNDGMPVMLAGNDR